jgi:hypothetical protein
VGAYERLVADWQVDPVRAADVLTWAIALVAGSVRQGDRPTREAAAI